MRPSLEPDFGPARAASKLESRKGLEKAVRIGHEAAGGDGAAAGRERRSDPLALGSRLPCSNPAAVVIVRREVRACAGEERILPGDGVICEEMTEWEATGRGKGRKEESEVDRLPTPGSKPQDLQCLNKQKPTETHPLPVMTPKMATGDTLAG